MNPEHEKDEANKIDDAKMQVEDLPVEEAEGDAVKGGPSSKARLAVRAARDHTFLDPP